MTKKIRSKILEDLRTQTLDDTVKLIEQMTFAKDTNARIEKRREDSKIAAVGKRNSKTLYQKDKKYRRMDKTPKNEKSHVMTCFNCGKDRDPHSKRVRCVKMGSVNCARSKGRSTNIVEISAIGPEKYHPIMVEADTGANITVFKAELLQEMAWAELEQTEMQIQGYSGIAENCAGKAMITLQLGSRTHDEEIYFSNMATSNYLSRDACIMFKIIPRGFPHAEVNTMKASDKTPKS